MFYLHENVQKVWSFLPPNDIYKGGGRDGGWGLGGCGEGVV